MPDNSFYDFLVEEIKKTGWITLGQDERGSIIQVNTKNKEIRKLDRWVVISKVNQTEQELEDAQRD